MKKVFVHCLFVAILALVSCYPSIASAEDGKPPRNFVTTCVQSLVRLGSRAFGWIPRAFRRRPEVPAAVELPTVIEKNLAYLEAAKAWGRTEGAAVVTSAVPGAHPQALASFDGISDGYLALEALTAARQRIVSADDLVGLALLVAERETFAVPGNFDRAQWAQGTKPYLGLRMAPPQWFVHPVAPVVVPPLVPLPLSESSRRSADEFRRGSDAIYEHLTAKKMRGSVSVFGSGSEHAEVNGLAEEIGFTLGSARFGVMTGGAEGSMAATNRGAMRAGAASIGIPVIGRHTPATEQRPALENHTLTVRVSDYTARIPLLLLPNTIVLLPGTKGTTRELGAVLLSARRRNRNVFFVGAGYWKDVFDAVQAAARRENAASGFYLVESAAELLQKLEQIIQASLGQ